MNSISSSLTLIKYLSDMSALEEHLVASIQRQENDPCVTKFPIIRDLLMEMKTVAVKHLKEMTDMELSHHAEWRAALKESLAVVTGTVMGEASKYRTHGASKLLRDHFVTLNLEVMGYTMLHATGLALRSSEIADLALRYLKDVAPLIGKINRLTVPVVIAELNETHSIDYEAEERASINVSKFWPTKLNSSHS